MGENIAEEPLPDKLNYQAQIDFFNVHPERATPGHLNNWSENMPGGENRNINFENKDALKQTLGEHEITDVALYSAMRLNQTTVAFFSTIDRQLDDLGINLRELERQFEIINTSPEGSLIIQARRKIEELTIPVYLALRKLGYTHFDLTN